MVIQCRRPLSRSGYILLAILFWALALCLLASPAQAAPPSPCAAQVGSSTFTSPDATAVQTAVDAASPGDLVKVAGICRGVGWRDWGLQTVYITTTLTLQGGYTTSNWIISDPTNNPTILDAAGWGRVVLVTGTVPVTLSNFIVTNGVVDGSGSTCPDAGCGGGVYSNGGPLTLMNLDVISNTATYDGGGLYGTRSATVTGGRFESNQANSGGGARVHDTMTVSGTEFVDNSSMFDGGGLYADSTLNITNAALLRNSGYNGGGLYAVGTLNISGTTFLKNTGSGAGGGAYASEPATLTGGRFEDNLALMGHGGGLYAKSTLDIAGTTFVSNTSLSGNGGGTYAYGRTTVSGGRFEGNRAALYGGGLYADSPLTMTATGFVSNSSIEGGGVYTNDTSDVTDAVFLGNQAWNGGAVYQGQNGRVVNGLFARNSASTGAALYSNASASDLLFSTIVSPTVDAAPAIYAQTGVMFIFDTIVASNTVPLRAAGGAAIFEDYNLFHATGPFLGSVVSGGHSLTGQAAFLDPANDDYHLTDASMAVDIGMDEGVYDDLDAVARPRGLGFDVGAYESPYAHAPDVTVAKSVAPVVAQSEQTITYTLTFSNAGLVRATDVWITDAVPAELTDVSYTSSGAAITPTGEVSYTWQVADLAPGVGGVITLTGVVDALPGVFTNTASVTATGMITPTQDRDAATVSVSVSPCYARVARTGATFGSADAAAVQQAVDAAEAGDLIEIAGTCRGVQPRAGTARRSTSAPP